MNDAYPGGDRLAIPGGASTKTGLGNKTLSGEVQILGNERTSFVEFVAKPTPVGTPSGSETKKVLDHIQRLTISQGNVKHEFDPFTLTKVATLSAILASENAEAADTSMTAVDEIVDASGTEHVGRFVLPVTLKPGVAKWQLDTFSVASAMSEWTTVTSLSIDAALHGYLERIQGMSSYHKTRAVFKASETSFMASNVMKAYIMAASGALSGVSVSIAGMTDYEVAENIAYFKRKQGGSGYDIIQIEPGINGQLSINLSSAIDFVVVMFQPLGA